MITYRDCLEGLGRQAGVAGDAATAHDVSIVLNDDGFHQSSEVDAATERLLNAHWPDNSHAAVWMPKLWEDDADLDDPAPYMTLRRGFFTTTHTGSLLPNALCAVSQDGQSILLMADEASGDDEADMATAQAVVDEADLGVILRW